MDILRGLLGIAVMLGIAYLLSSNRKAIDWKLVGSGLLMQVILALAILKIPFVRNAFDSISGVFVDILDFTREGSEFMFGSVVTDMNTFGYIFAFQVLPTIVFFSAFSAILYYFGVLQKIIYGFAWVMSKTMRLSGAESLAAAANIFIGQTEAPLVVKPYLEDMTKSEILSLMVGGMATIAGGVFAAYVGYLGGTDPVQQQLFATHLLTASIMSAPAALLIAKMLYPEDQPEKISENLDVPQEKIGSNLLDAISKGTSDGLRLAVNVGVMLLVFTALVYMVNEVLKGTIGDWTGLNEMVVESTEGRFDGFTLTYILGMLFAPIAWLLGVASDDIVLIGQLLGQKTVINEFVAYAEFGEMKTNPNFTLDPKSILIATYALCGFANFASIGIQIGGIGALAPGQRKTLSEFGIKALIGGTIACFITAAMAGIIVTDPEFTAGQQESKVDEKPQTVITMNFTDTEDKALAFQLPVSKLNSILGTPKSINNTMSCDSISVAVHNYGSSQFVIYDDMAQMQQIDFTDAKMNFSIQNDKLNLNAGTQLADFATAYPTAFANCIYSKDSTNANVQLMMTPYTKGQFDLSFTNGQLVGLQYQCEK